jgi:PPK2 family polyphosphate:nucleotide phosphotransferase
MALKPVPPNSKVKLHDRDALPPDDVDADDHELDAAQQKLLARLEELQAALYAESRQSLLVILQALDAGGKDGTTRKVFSSLNPQGCEVHSFKRPTEEELAHDFLWRAHRVVPRTGMIGIFNRSYYEDVLVVRVHDLVPKKVWKKRFDQINAFERMLTQNGVTILKFYLHISRAEQKRRLADRLEDPTKNWKFEPGDLEERERWDDYIEAYEDALSRCSTKWAPWYIVPADRKHARNLLVTQVIVDALERMDPQYPKADPSVRAYLKDLT